MVGPSAMALLVPSSKDLVAPSIRKVVAWLSPLLQVVVAAAAPYLQAASTEVGSIAIEAVMMLLWGSELGVLQPGPHHNNGRVNS